MSMTNPSYQKRAPEPQPARTKACVERSEVQVACVGCGCGILYRFPLWGSRDSVSDCRLPVGNVRCLQTRDGSRHPDLACRAYFNPVKVTPRGIPCSDTPVCVRVCVTACVTLTYTFVCVRVCAVARSHLRQSHAPALLVTSHAISSIIASTMSPPVRLSTFMASSHELPACVFTRSTLVIVDCASARSAHRKHSSV